MEPHLSARFLTVHSDAECCVFNKGGGAIMSPIARRPPLPPTAPGCAEMQGRGEKRVWCK